MMHRERVFRIPAIFTLLLLMMLGTLSAAPLWNEPVTVQQPDGTILHVLVSGDEYFNWMHDENGYTIIQDLATGYYTYATMSDGMPVPTQHVVGRVDPKTTGLSKHALPSPQKIISLRSTRFPGRSALTAADQKIEVRNTPAAGVINNVVVFIRFSDESEFGVLSAPYDSMFNASAENANSLYNYYGEVSYGQLAITTTFYPAPASGYVVSYQDSQPRGYYQPYSASNPIGYSGGDDSTERRNREHTLLANAVNAIAGSVPAGLQLDADGDGAVDNICFIVKGQPTGWSSLLWPHMWTLYSRSVYLNGKRVYNYNLQLQSSLGTSNVGVLAHEMFHSIGAPDLYHYSYDGLSPVGTWDLMESNRNPPQHMSAYMKYKYGGWIHDIPPITESGSYSLNPLTSSSNNVYRIDSPNSPGEYFVVEYRKRTGTFESSLPGDGLLVFRINPNYEGNADGPPDEVYLFRPNGTPTSNGSVSAAAFSTDMARTAINDSSNPYTFLTDGSRGGLDLYAVGGVGSTMSFSVRIPPLNVSRLTLSPSTILSGGSTTGTLLLSAGAPSGGKTISLSSNNPSVTVPATVQVAAGARTATFDATASPNAASADVTITASLDGVSQTAALKIGDNTPPSVVITTAGGYVSGTKSISATASDNIQVAGVQFKLDGNNLGAERTSAPYTIDWDSSAVSDGSHTITAVARDQSGNSQTSATVFFTVDNTAPSGSLSPGAGPYSGTSAVISATASDNFAVGGVQFRIDGQNLGTEVTSAPYTLAWDTTRFTNGSHSLTAAIHDLAGNVRVTAPLDATISNSTDFAISVASNSSNTATVAAGSTATYQLALMPSSGFTGTVSVSCSGAPAGATCTLNPASTVSVSGRNGSNVTVSVSTTAHSYASARPGPFNRLGLLWATALLPGLVLTGQHNGKARRIGFLVLIGLLLMSVLFLTACGGGSGSPSANAAPAPNPSTGTPAGTYTISVTGVTAAGSHTYDMKLIVN